MSPGLAALAAALAGTSVSGSSAATTLAVAANCERSALPCYTSIQRALDAAERDRSERWLEIRVLPGDYAEKPVIRRNRIRIVGAGQNLSRLHFGAVAQTSGRYHRANWGTPGSATLTINASDVHISGITIENTFDYLANDALAAEDVGKIANPQAVALLLDVDSDRVGITDTAILGYQDTLFTNGGHVRIARSIIAGNIDFIFGNGQLLIEDSEIRTRRRTAAIPSGDFHSFIAAPSTPLSQSTGIVVYRSRLTREAGVPDGSVALARPWHPTKRFADGRYADPAAVGLAMFIECHMGAHIHPEHWAPMNGTSKDGTMTTVFTPQEARFAERGSTGPGAVSRPIGLTWVDRRSIQDIRREFCGTRSRPGFRQGIPAQAFARRSGEATGRAGSPSRRCS